MAEERSLKVLANNTTFFNKVSKEDVPYMEFLENMPPITKDMIPDTSLMWEFVERPKKKD